MIFFTNILIDWFSKAHKINMKDKRKIAGLLDQIRIILRKNFILHFENKLGILFELIFLSVSFVFILISKYDNLNKIQRTFETKSHILENRARMDKEGEKFVYYFPNNTFIRNIINESINGMGYLKSVKLVGWNDSSPESVKSNLTNLTSLLAFVTFPDFYHSFEYVQNHIRYFIHTLEFVCFLFLKIFLKEINFFIK